MNDAILNKKPLRFLRWSLRVSDTYGADGRVIYWPHLCVLHIAASIESFISQHIDYLFLEPLFVRSRE